MHILHARTHARTHASAASLQAEHDLYEMFATATARSPAGSKRHMNGLRMAHGTCTAHARPCIGSPPPPRPAAPAFPARLGLAPPPPMPAVRPMSLLCACGATAPRDPRRRAPPARGGPAARAAHPLPSSYPFPDYHPCSGSRALLEQQSPEQLEAIKAAMADAVSVHRHGMHARAHHTCTCTARAARGHRRRRWPSP